MAISNFIPTIWSETLYTELDKKYIAVANSNRDFEGDIKEKGSVVKICGVGEVSVDNYTKNTDMSIPQDLSDTVVELAIDQAKYFNFQIDDIDKAQCTPKLMEAAMKVAASGLANSADAYIYNLAAQAQTKIEVTDTAANLIDYILKARTILYKNNVADASDIVVEVSPEVAERLFKEKMNISTDNVDSVENGYMGNIAGCKVYISNNILKTSGGSAEKHSCMVRTKRAIAFAEQLSEINAYRPERRFADAVKGLYLFGAKIVYPQELVVLDVTVNN